jgi:predicted nucleic acid-binding protein
LVKPPRLVLTDTNILLNLAIVDRLDLLGVFPDLRFSSPRIVFDEVLSPRERTRVERAVACGLLPEIAFDDIDTLALFSRLLRIMEQGEAACLALAVQHGAWVASDEKRAFRREAERLLGPGSIVTTPGLIVLAIRRKILTLEEADSIKRFLEQRRFKMTFGSFAEVV